MAGGGFSDLGKRVDPVSLGRSDPDSIRRHPVVVIHGGVFHRIHAPVAPRPHPVRSRRILLSTGGLRLPVAAPGPLAAMGSDALWRAGVFPIWANALILLA